MQEKGLHVEWQVSANVVQEVKLSWKNSSWVSHETNYEIFVARRFRTLLSHFDRERI